MTAPIIVIRHVMLKLLALARGLIVQLRGATGESDPNVALTTAAIKGISAEKMKSALGSHPCAPSKLKCKNADGALVTTFGPAHLAVVRERIEIRYSYLYSRQAAVTSIWDHKLVAY